MDIPEQIYKFLQDDELLELCLTMELLVGQDIQKRFSNPVKTLTEDADLVLAPAEFAVNVVRMADGITAVQVDLDGYRIGNDTDPFAARARLMLGKWEIEVLGRLLEDLDDSQLVGEFVQDSSLASFAIMRKIPVAQEIKDRQQGWELE